MAMTVGSECPSRVMRRPSRPARDSAALQRRGDMPWLWTTMRRLPARIALACSEVGSQLAGVSQVRMNSG